jgi:hypothetical protein
VSDTEQLVWYVAYGSNLSLDRFRYYLAGGCPKGARRTYPGCRNQADPVATDRLEVPGTLVFAGESTVWTGGMAFYDPDTAGVVAARAYLLTLGQFSDVVSQETRRPPEEDLDLWNVEPGGRQRLGSGRYNTLIHLGEKDGRPIFTITSTGIRLERKPPSAAYLSSIVRGLIEAYGWTSEQIADYLAGAPGVVGAWGLEQLRAVALDGRASQ